MVRVREFLEATTEIAPIQDTGLLSTLSGIPKIDGGDSGEALLFAAAVESTDPILATRDRNALCALLAHRESVPSVFAALQQRVVTFESSILLALHQIGFTRVKQKLLGSPKPDGVLRLVLKPEMNEPDLIDCLRSFSLEVEPLLLHSDLVLRGQSLPLDPAPGIGCMEPTN